MCKDFTLSGVVRVNVVVVFCSSRLAVCVSRELDVSFDCGASLIERSLDLIDAVR